MSQQELFQIEKSRSNEEHHKPTAGAMIGHITANLLVQTLKIEQARLFANGVTQLFLQTNAKNWQLTMLKFYHKLNTLLRSEGDLVPTILNEIEEYSMIEEDGSAKYSDGDEQLMTIVKDFDMQLLFIKKALSLANTEDHHGQFLELQEIYSWFMDQIRLTQTFLGHSLKEGLYNENEE